MVRKRIIVQGHVQGVGFRALVKLIARSLDVKGQVKNLDNGSVEIFCEGDVATIAKFMSTINIKHGNGNLLAIDVKKMEEHPEGSEGYLEGKPPKTFKPFEVNHGQRLSLAEQEMIERQELLIIGGSQVLDGLGIVGVKVDIVGQKVDKGFSELGHKVEGVGKNVKDLGENVKAVGQNVVVMHGDMNDKFMTMEKKYHTINKNIEKSNKNIERLIIGNTKTNKNLESISRALVKLIEKDISERKKTRKAGKT